jgi:outer membrane protein OmpA-like peptidoglycan-associated protein
MTMRNKLAVSALAGIIALGGCANMNEVQRGTATGAGIGAGLGAVIGAASGGGGRRAAQGAAVGGAAGAVIGNIWSARMEQQKRDMQQATQGTGIQVSQTPDNRLKMEIPSDISFDTNRADIKPNFRPILDRFASTLQSNPNSNVTIIGHTDSTGSDAINNPLSVNRAAETRQYLASHGVAPNRIQIDGRGSHEPIASNTTEATRARNRRVEIYVAEPQTTAQNQPYPQQPYPQQYPQQPYPQQPYPQQPYPQYPSTGSGQ